MKDFNAFIYISALHSGTKHFYCYCLQAFILKAVLKLIGNKGL